MAEKYFTRPGPSDDGSCDFCGIISGRMERSVRYEDEELVVFKNTLTWVPIMYLLVPKAHMSQHEFWRSPLFARASALAVDIAHEDSPEGFRLVSNFGEQASQTQSHGHLHLLGGGELGLYMDFPRKGDYWLRRFGHTQRRPGKVIRRPEQQGGETSQGDQQ